VGVLVECLDNFSSGYTGSYFGFASLDAAGGVEDLVHVVYDADCVVEVAVRVAYDHHVQTLAFLYLVAKECADLVILGYDARGSEFVLGE